MIIAVGNKTYEIEITEAHNKLFALVNSKKFYIEPSIDKYGQLTGITIDKEKYQVHLSKTKDGYQVNIFKSPVDVSIVSEKSETTQTTDKQIVVRAPMSGLVISMNLKPGQEVEVGSQLVILEAMKMQNEIKSPIKGKIQEIFVKVGQTVEKDYKLMSFEPVEDSV